MSEIILTPQSPQEIVFGVKKFAPFYFFIDLQGESLYIKWLELGFTGTELDFLEWLRYGDLNTKLDKGYFVGDAMDLYRSAKIYELDEMQVFKKKAKTDPTYTAGQQIGDYCIGFVLNEDDELEFISADYLGGDTKRKTSYYI